MSAPQYTPDTNNGQLPEDSSSSVPSLDVSELDDYYTDNGEKNLHILLMYHQMPKLFQYNFNFMPEFYDCDKILIKIRKYI